MRIEMLGQSQPLKEAEGTTILVVDDEEVIRDLCARALGDYRILQAENGQVALDLLEHHHADLILVDVMMPMMNVENSATSIFQPAAWKIFGA